MATVKDQERGAAETAFPWWRGRWALPVTLAGLVVGGAVAAVQDAAAPAALRGTMIALLLSCAAVDLGRRIIPNLITGPGSVLALVLGLTLDLGGEPERLLAGLLAGGFLLAAALVRPAGMGMGDVKLLGMMGLFLGRGIVVALFAALILNALTGVLIACRVGVRTARKTQLPFGPYLACGGLLAALVGDQIMRSHIGH